VRRRLAPFAAAALVAAGGAAGGLWLARSAPAAASTAATTWFAPYVDVTAAPTYQFQDPATDPAAQVVLGFVDAAGPDACTPAWGGRIGLATSEQILHLDRRVVAYREWGGSVVVSFGGPGATDLAVACGSAPALAAAYSAVVDRYGAAAVDVDLSPSTLADAAAVARCASALALLQRASGIPVWLSVPGSPSGLDTAEEAAVRTIVAGHVALAGVNVMAIDFGDGSDPPRDMLAAVESSLAAAHAQLGAWLPGPPDSRAVWRLLGVTVMIGQGGLAGETFTVTDAEDLAAFARRRGMARVSMWSLGRDTGCPRAAAPAASGWSGSCSGIGQSPLEFTTAFDRLRGSGPAAPFTAPAVVPDSPATDPYPQWRAGERYQAGYLVVWQGFVYQAKWYSQSTVPGTPASPTWDAPWVLIGPVLAGDRAPTLTTLPAGTHPAWSPASVYRAGAVVLYRGLPYRARYWTKGQAPAPDPIDLYSAPWQPLWTVPGEP
jgi:chitinase